MRKLYFLLAIISLLSGINMLNAQTVWTGPTTTFTKANGADWTLEANQDRITSNAWITRADTKGIFNIVSETFYTKNSSPGGTEWAFGTTGNVGSLTFQDWETTVGSKPLNMLNKDMVLHLIADSIYIDIKFTSWTSGTNGGGFSYTRSTDQTTNSTDFAFDNLIRLFPNPSKDYIQISGLIKTGNYEVYNILGRRVMEGMVSDKQKINVQNLKNGVYFFKLENETVLKFIKN